MVFDQTTWHRREPDASAISFLGGGSVPDEAVEHLPEVVEVVARQNRVVDVAGRRINELDGIESGPARSDVAAAWNPPKKSFLSSPGKSVYSYIIDLWHSTFKAEIRYLNKIKFEIRDFVDFIYGNVYDCPLQPIFVKLTSSNLQKCLQ